MKRVMQILLALMLVFSAVGCTRINAGHVGILVNNAGSNRGVQDYTTSTGWVFYNPVNTQVVEYPTYMQNYVWTQRNSEGDESFKFNTNNEMAVDLDVNLSYQLDQSKIPAFYVKFRNDDLTGFTFGYLHNVARDCFTTTGGQYTVEALMSNNAPFVDAVKQCVQNNVRDIGINISQFGIIGTIRPPQQIVDSINAKVQAQQIALQKEMEVKQAEAEAQKQVATAQGEAQSRIAIAEGEAKANQLLTSSLTPQLLQWRQLQIQADAVAKWNGQRPQVEGSGSGLLLNITPTQKGN